MAVIQVLPTIHVTSASERSGGGKVSDALQAAVESAEGDKMETIMFSSTSTAAAAHARPPPPG